MKLEEITEAPTIKPFKQNPLNPAELEKGRDKFTMGWTVKYNTVQVAVAKEEYTPKPNEQYH